MKVEQWVWQPPLGEEEFDATVLTHAGVQLVILPARGGKIVSICHLASDAEWLWMNDQLPWHPLNPADSYTARHDVGGWDECFPTVAPTTVEGTTWPDHGDLWWRPWQCDSRDGRLHMSVEGEQYRFERTIRPVEGGFRFDYTVTNQGSTPLPYLWCAHPLLCIDPPLSLDLVGRPEVLLTGSSLLGKAGERQRWPKIAGRDLATIGKPSGLAAKLFVEVESGEVRLHHPTGASWRLRWPLDELPFLGLWINEGGWSGTGGEPYCNLGVEPTTTPADDLGGARGGGARRLAPGEQRRWWLHLEFDAEP